MDTDEDPNLHTEECVFRDGFIKRETKHGHDLMTNEH